MASILSFVIQGATLGLTASISPGPLLLFLISQSLSGNWKRGAVVALAPLLTDAPLILLSLLLLIKLPPLFLHMISIAGGIFVIFLAGSLFSKWRENNGQRIESHPRLAKNLGQAILINFFNPGPYLFWTLVNGPLLVQALQNSIYHGIVFLLSFYCPFIGGMLVLAVVFSQAKRLGDKVVRILTLLSTIILGIFGLVLIFKGLNAIL